MKLREPVILIVLCTMASACGDESSQSSQLRPDGARIRSVRVDPVPVIKIGVEDGPEEYQLFKVRDAVRLDDGSLVVSNGGSGELRFYAPTGEYIRAVGRKGAGPAEFGEYSNTQICRAPGGRLFAHDGDNGRIHVFTTAGNYLKTVTLRTAGGGRTPQIAACSDNGTMVGISWPDGGVLRGEPGEVIQVTMDYVVIDTVGQVTSSVAQSMGRPRFVNTVGNITNFPFVPFTVDPSVAVGTHGVYVLNDSEPRVLQYRDGRGEPTVVEWPAAGRQAIKEVWDRYVEAELADITDANRRRRYARFFAQPLPLPDSTPAAQSILVDREDYIWLERFRLPWDEQSTWDVLDPTGQWIDAVNLPETIEIFDIGSDYVLGRSTDTVGVERIVLYRLERMTRKGPAG